MHPLLREALQESRKARYLAPPNPWVGCILENNGEVVGRGHTQPPGKPHAEPMALKAAGERAEGATAYVTLEPCCHTGRTPPCTKALIAAGVKKVHIGVLDPDRRVSGEGAAALQRAGIEVTKEQAPELIEEELAPYLHFRKTGLPYVVLKTATSIDGRVAAADGTSQWITCEEARRDVHIERDLAQAIVVGSGTALADKPALTVRHVPRQSIKPALRVLIDRRGRISTKEQPFDLVHQGDLLSLLQELAKQDVMQVLIEGGPTLHSAFLQENLVQRLIVYLGPKLLGDAGTPLAALPITTLAEATKLRLLSCKKLGESARLDYSI